MPSLHHIIQTIREQFSHLLPEGSLVLRVHALFSFTLVFLLPTQIYITCVFLVLWEDDIFIVLTLFFLEKEMATHSSTLA